MLGKTAARHDKNNHEEHEGTKITKLETTDAKESKPADFSSCPSYLRDRRGYLFVTGGCRSLLIQGLRVFHLIRDHPGELAALQQLTALTAAAGYLVLRRADCLFGAPAGFHPQQVAVAP